MTIHVLEIPHRPEPWWESFNHLARRFAGMMTDLGYDVVLHGATDGRADITFAAGDPSFRKAARKQVVALRESLEPRDVICVTAGNVMKPVTDQFPCHQAVEYAVGYTGVYTAHRVFASYSLMHAIYGEIGTADGDGYFYDDVIPHWVDPAAFPFVAEPDDYLLYLGRLTDRKGWRIAQQACEQAGVRFLAAGAGEFDGYGEYLGEVDDAEKATLLGGARAVFCPTVYLEPFGLVAVEAMMCGTPVISTDWGAFTETVVQGVTGFRCRLLHEFVQAISLVDRLDRSLIGRYAASRFAAPAVGPRYDRFFRNLASLWGDGWYASNGPAGREDSGAVDELDEDAVHAATRGDVAALPLPGG